MQQNRKEKQNSPAGARLAETEVKTNKLTVYSH